MSQLNFYTLVYYIRHTLHVALYLYKPSDTFGLYCRYPGVHHRYYTNYHQTNRYTPHPLYETKPIQEFYLYFCNKYRILYRQTLCIHFLQFFTGYFNHFIGFWRQITRLVKNRRIQYRFNRFYHPPSFCNYLFLMF